MTSLTFVNGTSIVRQVYDALQTFWTDLEVWVWDEDNYSEWISLCDLSPVPLHR